MNSKDEDDELFTRIVVSLVMPTMSDKNYTTKHWPMLRAGVDQLLLGPPKSRNAETAIQFEPMYSAAYKCVCQQHSKDLYTDLTSHLQNHFSFVAAEIQKIGNSHLVNAAYAVVSRVMYSLDGILPIFSYLNRTYVKNVLNSNLREELQRMFCSIVLDPIMDQLMGIITDSATSDLFEVPPPHVLAFLVKSIHNLNSHYCHKYTAVFSRFIPLVLPAITESELPSYVQMTLELQRSMRQTWSGQEGGRGIKRPLGEESAWERAVIS